MQEPAPWSHTIIGAFLASMASLIPLMSFSSVEISSIVWKQKWYTLNIGFTIIYTVSKKKVKHKLKGESFENYATVKNQHPSIAW